MKELITSHLRALIAQGSLAIRSQFVAKNDVEESQFWSMDPLGEDTKYSPLKGLVRKYDNRVLWKVSYRCAAHCQFCTRARQVGSKEGDLTGRDVQHGLEYLCSHPEIDDVILSGGDPLFTPRQTLRILNGLAQIETVRVVRIGTRLPIHSPASLKTTLVTRLLKRVREISLEKAVYILLHVNHPDELTPEVQETIKLLEQKSTSVLSQTVFLHGINDNVRVLQRLFNELYYLGVRPYNIYRCDYVRGLERFVCNVQTERHIMTELRRTVSGIALPTYVVDVPGSGKLPVPLEFWDVPDITRCRDFDNNDINL